MVAQVPMPRVFVVDDPSLNAFATGSSPENAAVAATSGILAVMNREELEGVIGHEISHIRNYDIRISTIAVALASAITLISIIFFSTVLKLFCNSYIIHQQWSCRNIFVSCV